MRWIKNKNILTSVRMSLIRFLAGKMIIGINQTFSHENNDTCLMVRDGATAFLVDCSFIAPASTLAQLKNIFGPEGEI